MNSPLGPFDAIWSAWDESNEAIIAKPIYHFRRAAEIQYEELEKHLANGDMEKAAREAVDVISVALNTLRWLNLEPEEVAEIARNRAETRMRGRTTAILKKYQDEHDI